MGQPHEREIGFDANQFHLAGIFCRVACLTTEWNPCRRKAFLKRQLGKAPE